LWSLVLYFPSKDADFLFIMEKYKELDHLLLSGIIGVSWPPATVSLSTMISFFECVVKLNSHHIGINSNAGESWLMDTYHSAQNNSKCRQSVLSIKVFAMDLSFKSNLSFTLNFSAYRYYTQSSRKAALTYNDPFERTATMKELLSNLHKNYKEVDIDWGDYSIGIGGCFTFIIKRFPSIGPPMFL
jgi:hypothetical protein